MVNDVLQAHFIYVCSTGEKVSVSKAQHDAYYREADRIRHKEQHHKRCMCPYRYIWKCDGDCSVCEYHAAGDTLSLDSDTSYFLPDNSPPVEDVIIDRLLIEQLFKRLRELDRDADIIIRAWIEDPSVSDRAIAGRLGRKQRTFADRMKRIRSDLKRICE